MFWFGCQYQCIVQLIDWKPSSQVTYNCLWGGGILTSAHSINLLLVSSSSLQVAPCLVLLLMDTNVQLYVFVDVMSVYDCCSGPSPISICTIDVFEAF